MYYSYQVYVAIEFCEKVDEALVAKALCRLGGLLSARAGSGECAEGSAATIEWSGMETNACSRGLDTVIL